MLGAGTARDGAWDILVDLAESLGTAVYAGTYASRNVFPETHPLFRGFVPPFREQQRAMLAGHDLIVTLGGPLNLYHAEGEGAHLPEGRAAGHSSDDPGVLAWAPQGDAILGNIRLIAQTLLHLVPSSDRPLARAACRGAAAEPRDPR